MRLTSRGWTFLHRQNG